jgi:hypothetical protein
MNTLFESLVTTLYGKDSYYESANDKVKLVVLDALGRRAEKALTVRVGPLEDRNAALAGR